MTHLFKIQLANSDMFVKEIDFEKSMIRFQIREKESGRLLESESYLPFSINDVEQKIEFGSRFIALNLAVFVANVLS